MSIVNIYQPAVTVETFRDDTGPEPAMYVTLHLENVKVKNLKAAFEHAQAAVQRSLAACMAGEYGHRRGGQANQEKQKRMAKTTTIKRLASRVWRRYLGWVGFYIDSPNPLNPEAWITPQEGAAS